MSVGQREKKAPCAGEGPLVDTAPEDMEDAIWALPRSWPWPQRRGRKTEGPSSSIPPRPPPLTAPTLCAISGERPGTGLLGGPGKGFQVVGVVAGLCLVSRHPIGTEATLGGGGCLGITHPTVNVTDSQHII